MRPSMLRHSRAGILTFVAAALVALAASGCGIKGPLELPPKAEAAKDGTQAPASRKP